MFAFITDYKGTQPELGILTAQEYEFIVGKNPRGVYDRDTRENIYWILEKLEEAGRKCSRLEKRLYKTFIEADFGILVKVHTEISGKIVHPGRVTIEGRFDGEIHVQDTLTVEKNGVVCAKVSAGKVVCKGEIHGDVEAKSIVRITSVGRIHGAIHTPSIEIEEGANFEGQCHTEYKPVPPPPTGWQWKKISTYRWTPA